MRAIFPANNEDAAYLRGSVYFAALRAAYIMNKYRWRHGRVHIGFKGSEKPCPDEILYFVMPTGEGTVNNLTRRSECGMPVIADVTADVLGLTQPSEAMREAGRKGSTEESWLFWRREDVLRDFEQCLKLSTVITTSWPELVQPLACFGKPVIHLPDMDAEDPNAFRRNMSRVYRTLSS
jgi:hypothetical protein